VKRLIAILITAAIASTALPLAATAAPREERATERPAVREQAAPREAARPVERPVVRERIVEPRAIAPRYVARPVERPVVRERIVEPRAVAPRYVARPVERPVVRERIVEPRAAVPRYESRPVERPVVRERIVEPRAVIPRYHVRDVERPIVREHRNRFVRTYSRAYVTAPVTRQRVVFRRYVPQRIFIAPPVQVVRTYAPRPSYYTNAVAPMSYVYTGYAPVYTVMQSLLPISWAPVAYANQYTAYGDQDEDDNGSAYNSSYNPYGYADPNQYASYQQYPYANQYPYGGQYPYGTQQYGYGQFGAAPFGNAQLQGVVIANTNGGILVMTSSLKPVFVNTSIAQQNGYVNGTISPGSFVNVFGYDTGSEFIATALG